MDQPVPLSPITVDVVSDVVCPWCYLGKSRLEHAIARVPEIPVEIRWRPYSLDPTVPREGEDRAAHIIRKFGSLAALDEGHRRLTDLGRAEGITYNFDRITRSPNALDAHRVGRWAADAGKGEAMVERLFAAYFSEGRDVGDHAVLASLASEVGLSGAKHYRPPRTGRRQRCRTGRDRGRISYRCHRRALLHSGRQIWRRRRPVRRGDCSGHPSGGGRGSRAAIFLSAQAVSARGFGLCMAGSYITTRLRPAALAA